MKKIEIAFATYVRCKHEGILPDHWRDYDEYWLLSSGSPNPIVDAKINRKEFYQEFGE